jgi:hypothetical protein
MNEVRVQFTKNSETVDVVVVGECPTLALSEVYDLARPLLEAIIVAKGSASFDLEPLAFVRRGRSD